jgi:manganese/iron transport system substrate-binding protein
MLKRRFFLLPAALLLISLVAGCAAPSTANGTANQAGKLKVVATTTMIGDVVRNVGGDAIALTVLLPVGSDPHTFQPTPQDVARLADADIIFLNGIGLEANLQQVLGNISSQATQVIVSDGITPLKGTGAEGAAQPASSGKLEDDPHVWMDPNQVVFWVKNIESTLSKRDPANAARYQRNAAQYRQALVELDRWVSAQTAELPQANRKLVSDHQELGYFANRYGFEQVGAVIPSVSTSAEPSAQELAQLENAIHSLGVKAVFVDRVVNPVQSQRLASDTGAQIVTIYTGSLSDANGPAATYLDFIRYNVNAIVNALK